MRDEEALSAVPPCIPAEKAGALRSMAHFVV